MKTGGEVRASETFRSVLKVLILWLSFSSALLINKGPIFFPDTSAYFRVADAAIVWVGGKPSIWSNQVPITRPPMRPAHMVEGAAFNSGPAPDTPTPLAGRSIYYGTALLILGPILAALGQGFVAACAVVMAARRLSPHVPYPLLPLVIGLSSGPIFAALLMPDILAALAVLACAMILTDWRRMRRPERIFWFCLLLAGVLAHSATLLIVVIVFIISWLWRRARIAAWPIVFAVAGGFLGEIGFGLAVSHAIGSQPLRPPFLSARLVADGPGRTFLHRDCARVRRFRLCSFYQQLPANSDAILWGQNGAGFISMPAAVQREWSSEDARFAVIVFANEPLKVLRSSGVAILRQAAVFRIDDVVQPLSSPNKLPPRERALYYSTLISHDSFPAYLWSGTSLFLLVLSLGTLLVFRRRLSLNSAIVLIGIGVDVVICGALSTPHDRYLTRLVWLLPLVALGVGPCSMAVPARGMMPLGKLKRAEK